MTIFLIIIGIILLMCGMSIAGWILKGLMEIVGLFFEGIGNCLGCVFKLGFWVLLIIILILSIVG